MYVKASKGAGGRGGGEGVRDAYNSIMLRANEQAREREREREREGDGEGGGGGELHRPPTRVCCMQMNGRKSVASQVASLIARTAIRKFG